MRRAVAAVRSRTLRWFPVAALAAVVVEIGLRTTTLARLCRVLGVTLTLRPAPDGTPVPGPGHVDPGRERAAHLAVRMWPWGRTGRCLRQSLVTGFLLRGRHPRLHLGVAHRSGSTVAHAWLTVDGVALDPTVAEYTPLRERAGGSCVTT